MILRHSISTQVLINISLFIVSIVIASIYFGYFTIKIQLRISIRFTCSSFGELFMYSYMTSHEHVLRIPFVRGLNDEKGPMRRVETTRRGFEAAEFDEEGVKASMDIIFIMLSLTIFPLFVLLESYYWRCLSGFSPLCGHVAMCFAPIVP
jgi:hypothetical protein